MVDAPIRSTGSAMSNGGTSRVNAIRPFLPGNDASAAGTANAEQATVTASALKAWRRRFMALLQQPEAEAA
jgi:hypothetical protein